MNNLLKKYNVVHCLESRPLQLRFAGFKAFMSEGTSGDNEKLRQCGMCALLLCTRKRKREREKREERREREREREERERRRELT